MTAGMVGLQGCSQAPAHPSNFCCLHVWYDYGCDYWKGDGGHSQIDNDNLLMVIIELLTMMLQYGVNVHHLLCKCNSIDHSYMFQCGHFGSYILHKSIILTFQELFWEFICPVWGTDGGKGRGERGRWRGKGREGKSDGRKGRARGGVERGQDSGRKAGRQGRQVGEELRRGNEEEGWKERRTLPHTGSTPLLTMPTYMYTRLLLWTHELPSPQAFWNHLLRPWGRG